MNMSESKLFFPSSYSLPIQPYGFPILRKSTVLLAPMLKSTGHLGFQILHSVPTSWNSTLPSSDIFCIVVLQVRILPPLFPDTVPSHLDHRPVLWVPTSTRLHHFLLQLSTVPLCNVTYLLPPVCLFICLGLSLFQQGGWIFHGGPQACLSSESSPAFLFFQVDSWAEHLTQ